jgi:AraC-like DNA-binding protein
MSIIYESRSSNSPFVDLITRGYTAGDGSSIRPAETCWHMVFVRHQGGLLSLVVGPWTTSGIATWGKDAEILWIKFRLGTFMPHLATKDFRNSEKILPDATSQSFWLNGSVLQIPNYDNAESFIERLVHQEILVRDLLVSESLQDHPLDISPRTIRYRFLRSTGLTQSHIRLAERAQQAATLIEHGNPILDTAYELGYFDQPHLTRSLKQFIGYTPSQIQAMKKE